MSTDSPQIDPEPTKSVPGITITLDWTSVAQAFSGLRTRLDELSARRAQQCINDWYNKRGGAG